MLQTSTRGEVSCHLSAAVTGLSNSIHSDIIFLSAQQGARLAAGEVGDAVGRVPWRSCEHSDVEQGPIAGLPGYVSGVSIAVCNRVNAAWLARSCRVKESRWSSIYFYLLDWKVLLKCWWALLYLADCFYFPYFLFKNQASFSVSYYSELCDWQLNKHCCEKVFASFLISLFFSLFFLCVSDWKHAVTNQWSHAASKWF